jgi:hypothetical protein
VGVNRECARSRKAVMAVPVEFGIQLFCEPLVCRAQRDELCLYTERSEASKEININLIKQ